MRRGDGVVLEAQFGDCFVKRIYVGNLGFRTEETSLEAAFAEFGAVNSVDIIKDRYSGESRGFGFVEMSDDGEAAAAIEGMNGKDLDGRALKVNEAKEREPRSGGGRGGHGGGGRGGYGGGGDRGGY